MSVKSIVTVPVGCRTTMQLSRAATVDVVAPEPRLHDVPPMAPYFGKPRAADAAIAQRAQHLSFRSVRASAKWRGVKLGVVPVAPAPIPTRLLAHLGDGETRNASGSQAASSSNVDQSGFVVRL